nr:unknown [Lotus japonicus]
MEVRERTPLLREVRVRARHGTDASDEEDPRTIQTNSPSSCCWWRLRSPHPQTCKCLMNELKEPLLASDGCFFMFFFCMESKFPWNVCRESATDCLYFISCYFPCCGTMFLLQEIKFLVKI